MHDLTTQTAHLLHYISCGRENPLIKADCKRENPLIKADCKIEGNHWSNFPGIYYSKITGNNEWGWGSHSKV